MPVKSQQIEQYYTHDDTNTHSDQKFSGMLSGAEAYHAGARLYDPEVPRFWGVDVMRGKYPNLSSYLYVGNNPLIYIDPDGRDRRLIYNHSNKTITVKATYYHNINSTSSANAGVRVINNIKGMEYKDSEGTTWKIRFQLTAKRSSNPEAAARYDDQGNSIERKDNLRDPRTGGRASGLATNNAIVVDTRLETEFTAAHEMGHTLGMANRECRDCPDRHSDSEIMSTDVNRNASFTQDNINQMIQEGKGPVENTTSIWSRIKNFFSKD